MDKLICDMLRYSSLLRADVPLSAVNVAELLRAIIDETAPFQAHKADIQFETRIPTVIGNSDLLKQCFATLLDNALRYTRPGVVPKIAVTARSAESRVIIAIEDNGTGMPKEFQERVFGIFQKGTNSSDGTGIGLALVRVAVRRMSGHVGVTAEEGKGSRFWIELKAAD
jgi:signal transduction histidine kinase